MTGFILFSISGCEKPPKDPLVLTHYEYFKIYEPELYDLYNEKYMVSYTGCEIEVDEDVPKTVTVEIQGYEITADYKRTFYSTAKKAIEVEYDAPDFYIYFDKNSNELLRFYFMEFPGDYVKKTEYLTGEQAKSVVDEFMKLYVNLNEWTWIDNGFKG